MSKTLSVFLAISLKLIMVTCVEFTKEQEWAENHGIDNFFEYAELAEGNQYYYNINGRDVNNYSNNVDLDLFNIKENIKVETAQAPTTSSNIVSLFLNTIKKVVQPQRIEVHQNVKETSKGLDIKFDANTNLLPNLGNNQDSKFTVVGTLWCGPGDVAKDKNSIGYFYLTDSCCREHDLCPMTLAAQETKYGLKNSGKFTRAHCDCDQKFYQCLKNVNSMVSKQVGSFYFNVLGHQCFREDYPLKRCKNSVKSRCVNYETDSTQAKSFQWLDIPWF